MISKLLQKVDDRLITVYVLALFVSGCGPDSNAAPTYTNGGLASNCRAYIQLAVDGYRGGQHTADEAINGIERNCGMSGSSWAK